jgi:ABC-type lipopolysaccharide export system ATPase subunit
VICPQRRRQDHADARDLRPDPSDARRQQRIRARGLTVLMVERNVRQVLHVVGRTYLLKAGILRAFGTADALLQSEQTREAYLGV